MADKTYKTTIQIGGAVSSSLASSLKITEAQVAQTQQALDATNALLIAGFAAVSAAAVAGLTYASYQAIEFESQMSNVATLLDGDVSAKIDTMSQDIMDMAENTITSTELLTDGAYQVISAFGEQADSMEVLEIAAKGATAGNSDVTDSVDLLSAVTKAYGDTSYEAVAQVSDLAFLTVKLGQTTYPELASAIGGVTSQSSLMKISQEELFGVMATLTGVTGSASEVTTQFKALLNEMIDPSTDLAEIISDLGYESSVAMTEQLGLGDSLNAVLEAVDNNDIAFGNLFGSTEAQTIAWALTGAQADTFTEKTLAMADAAGATETAFATATDNVSSDFERLKIKINNVAIKVGTALLPYFEEWIALTDNIDFSAVADEIIVYVLDIADGVSGLINFINNNGPLIVALLAGVTAGIIAFKIQMTALTLAQLGFNTAMLANPLFLIPALIVAIIAGVVYMYAKFEWFRDLIDGIFSFITNMFSSIGGFIGDIVSEISGIFSTSSDEKIEMAYEQGFLIDYDATQASTESQNYSSVPEYALGGTVTSPHLALVGDAPETIVPHGNSARSVSLLQEAAQNVYGSTYGGSTIYITFSPVIYANSNKTDVKQAVNSSFEEFERLLDKYFKTKGRVTLG